MAQEKLVEKLSQLTPKVLDQIEMLNLFALIQRDDQENWDLVVSSGTFVGKEKDFLKKFVELLQGNLTNDELRSIARVVLLKPENPIVRNINQIGVRGGTVTVENSSFNKMLIRKMHLFYSARSKK